MTEVDPVIEKQALEIESDLEKLYKDRESIDKETFDKKDAEIRAKVEKFEEENAFSLESLKERVYIPPTQTENLQRVTFKVYLEILMCGTWQHPYKAKTGVHQSFQAHCGHYREGCAICLERRAFEMRERLHNVFAQGGGVSKFVTSDESVATQVVRSMTKGDYFRTMDVNGNYLIFVGYDVTEGPKIGEPLDPLHFHEDLNWNDIAMTPKGVNISGSLGKQSNGTAPDLDLDDEEEEPKQKDDPDEEPVSFCVYSLVQGDEISKDDMQEALDMAYDRTWHLYPDKVEMSVRRALAVRTIALVNALRELGYNDNQFKLIKSYQKVKLSSIDWDTELRKILAERNELRRRKGKEPICMGLRV